MPVVYVETCVFVPMEVVVHSPTHLLSGDGSERRMVRLSVMMGLRHVLKEGCGKFYRRMGRQQAGVQLQNQNSWFGFYPNVGGCRMQCTGCGAQTQPLQC